MNPLISIIVPVYKVEKYLSKCVNSIINQTYKNLQIILVDDGSPDNCGAICDDYAKTDSRIIVIHKPNGGLSDARNAGIEVSEGEYISFVDSDDWLLPDFYQHCYSVLMEYKADMVACPLCSFNEGQEIVNIHMSGDIIILDDEMAMESMFHSDGIPWCGQAKLYKKELLGDIRFPKGLLMEDKATSYKLFSKCKKIVFSKKEGYMYLVRPGSIMHSSFTERNIKTFEIQKELNNFIKENYPSVVPTTKAYTSRVALSMVCNMVAADYQDKEGMKELLSTGYSYRKEMYKSNAVNIRYKLLGHLIWPMYKLWGDNINNHFIFKRIAKFASVKIKSR